MNHRKIWTKHFGQIPKDKDGRSYEIHHIDGNHKNNDINNLKLVSIQEHFKIHESQGDWAACSLIAKRMNLPPDYSSSIQKGKKRPGVGGAKKGRIPWNKGKQNCFSADTIKKMSNCRKGKVWNTKTKINKNLADFIRKDFSSHQIIDGVGKKQKNGRILTQERAYSNLYHSKFNITSVQLYNIIKGESWKK